MNWGARTGWGLLTVATLAVAAAPYVVSLPEPRDAIVVDRAIYMSDGGSVPVELPHGSSFPAVEPLGSVRYVAHFNLAARPTEPILVYIPVVNRHLSLMLNNEMLFDSDQVLLLSPLVSAPVLVTLPRPSLLAGSNELVLELKTGTLVPARKLSKIYIGTESALVPNFRLRAFLQERLIVIALGAQILLGIGVLFAYFVRPHDPLFSWLAALVLFTSIVSISVFTEFGPGMADFRLYAGALSTAVGFLFIGVVLALVEVPPPRILYVATIVVPADLLLAVIFGLVSNGSLVAAISFPILFVSFATGAAIAAWNAFLRGNSEARLMLSPLFLFCCFSIRDIGVSTGFLSSPILLSPYVRPLFLAMIVVVLMRRLAVSLHKLDHSNENLNRKLAAREDELASLHRQERLEGARQIREQERQRLTHDLHDGISGHLVSIIAMAERIGGDVEPIEQAARQALDDLRLVIYSLDLGDRELRLALANFRERLIPQLYRIGVELDWSTAELPEVSGVTPGNALTILRILQEAITNALKHGPARRITIRGRVQGESAAITVENDGRPFAAGQRGHGLENMRRRACQLQAGITLDAIDGGTRLTLLLPASLPDIRDE